MKKFLTVAALATATVASSMIVSTDQANAQFRRVAPLVAVGAAAVIAGTVIANSAPVRCGWVRQYDRWGNYMGRVQVCNAYPY